MMKKVYSTQEREKLTSRAVFTSCLLSEPLTSLFLLFPIILYRDLQASAFQIALFAASRPVMAIFSLYWTSSLGRNPQKLMPNLIWAGVLARLPFFFFPLITTPWEVILCTSFYWLFLRGGMPAWMEILKLNLPKEKRSKVFSYSAAWAYAEGILIGIAIGCTLDSYYQAWRWVFPISASIGVAGVYFQSKVPLNCTASENKDEQLTLAMRVYKPWVDSWQLLQRRPDFLQFQWGFMCCGFALMILYPAAAIFYTDTLHISYTDLAIGVSICKGIGFALSSRWWNHKIQNLKFPRFASLVFLGFAIYPLILRCSEWSMGCFYVAFLIYGIAQAGSHLSWHLSGTLFAQQEESSIYSSVNIVTVGVRGLIAPTLGAFLCQRIDPTFVFGLSALLSIYSTWYSLSYQKNIESVQIRN